MKAGRYSKEEPLKTYFEELDYFIRHCKDVQEAIRTLGFNIHDIEEYIEYVNDGHPLQSTLEATMEEHLIKTLTITKIQEENLSKVLGDLGRMQSNRNARIKDGLTKLIKVPGKVKLKVKKKTKHERVRDLMARI